MSDATVLSENYATAGQLAIGGAVDVQVGYLLAIVQGVRDEVITFNSDAASGKGQFKGGTKLIQIVADAGEPMPTEFKGLVSKGCKVIQAVGAELVDPKITKDADLVEAVYNFVRAHGGISKLYGELFPTETPESTATLAGMVANLLAWSRKNGHEDGSVVAELISQVEAAPAEEVPEAA